MYQIELKVLRSHIYACNTQDFSRYTGCYYDLIT